VETEIVFCERCGVSIPESEVARVRQASGGRDLCPNCVHPRREADGDLRLYFCENCRVSIAVSEVLTGLARPDGTGYLCSVCTRATPAERVTRRTAVEREMAAAAAPAAAPRHAGADPIYFCDVCTASIPAAHVATGRAVVQSGRTLCERCGARPGAGRIHEQPGPGAVPVLAAGLLAVAIGAGGWAAWQAWGAAAPAAPAADADAVAALRRDAARDRADNAAALAQVTQKAEAAIRGLEARADAALAAARAAEQLAAAKARGADGLDGRMDDMDGRMDDIEDEIRALRGAVADRRDAAAESPMPMPPPAPEMTEGEPGPDPAPAGGAVSRDPADAVKRCVALLKDKEIGVRFAAALELGKIAGKRAPKIEGGPTETADFDYAWPALAQSMRKDDDAFVRRACARSLGEIKAWDAFPELCEAMLDQEEYVALQGSRVIKEMAGQDFGFRQNQAKADRKRVSERAKKWWEENKDRIAR
jgi:hypothetical protein